MISPTSTYRLQFGPNLGFDAAADLAGYLADLGAGAVYASPLLQASPGSTHGYDVVDPTRASEMLGGEDGRQRLARRLRERGLGLVVDIVPNHMGVADAAANTFWADVLANGHESRYSNYFDIDWSRGPLLIPVLGDDGLDGLTVEDGELRYHEHRFPLAPGTADGTPQQVHERQHYRLVSWRLGNRELTYRRFFDITTLAAVRVEDPEVFDATHREVLRWVGAGDVTGLRVDHPDGLADPGGYLRRLREAAPEAWLVVEKILGVGEQLPASWPVDGTTGYDALREVCGLFVDPAGEPGDVGLDAVERDCRRMVGRRILVAEVRRIARLVADHPPERVEDAVVELLAAFPVYRSYLPEHRWALDQAVESAEAARPELVTELHAIAAAMLADPAGELATRVQQTSGMVMAKGVEDTAFYRYNRFTALNEVGGDPGRFGATPAEVHQRAAARAAGWPVTMTTLSTHDTKRGEDVRARLAVLSELPGDFSAAVERWHARLPLPEPSLEQLAWQTLVGAWPLTTARLRDYLLKAAKEAKLATSWTDPDAEFDAAVEHWSAAVLADPVLSAGVAAFAERITPPGWSNALGQKLVHLAGPGVPDVYQGTELWDGSLVDPDNRRPVDFEARRRLLAELDGGKQPGLDASGAAKLLVVSRTLRLRRDRPECFTGYRPLEAQGPLADHAFAFSRGRASELVAVVTRLPVGLAARGGWAAGYSDTVLPLPAGPRRWTDLLTGYAVEEQAPALSRLLATYPVALLHRS
ncbi:malto-oligosyltrehalose synthase [Flindersiella endophytica]